MWVQNAQRDHFDFMSKMRERGVEVLELHNVLAETLDIPEAKVWLLDRKITANEVGLGLVAETRAYLESLTSRDLAELMIGGMSADDLPQEYRTAYLSLTRISAGIRDYLMPPLPNTLYTRDTTWLALRRGHLQPALLAGPAGRDPALQGRLQLPPVLRRVDDVVGRSREGLGPRHLRGW
jgi:arginine deiminase